MWNIEVDRNTHFTSPAIDEFRHAGSGIWIEKALQKYVL